jgi:hypothetical protein
MVSWKGGPGVIEDRGGLDKLGEDGPEASRGGNSREGDLIGAEGGLVLGVCLGPHVLAAVLHSRKCGQANQPPHAGADLGAGTGQKPEVRTGAVLLGWKAVLKLSTDGMGHWALPEGVEAARGMGSRGRAWAAPGAVLSSLNGIDGEAPKRFLDCIVARQVPGRSLGHPKGAKALGDGSPSPRAQGLLDILCVELQAEGAGGPGKQSREASNWYRAGSSRGGVTGPGRDAEARPVKLFEV